MRRIRIIFIIIYSLCKVSYGQNNIKPDSVYYDTLGSKQKLIYELVIDENESFYFTSYRDSKNRHHSKSLYIDGTRRSEASCNYLRTLKTKKWDKNGRLIGKYRQRPFGSTSYVYTFFEKHYNEYGRLIEHKRLKYHVSCFENRGLYRYKIITYDENGKKISKKRKGRLGTWLEWKKSGNAVRLKDE